jgi:hypothetical protein
MKSSSRRRPVPPRRAVRFHLGRDCWLAVMPSGPVELHVPDGKLAALAALVRATWERLWLKA